MTNDAHLTDADFMAVLRREGNPASRKRITEHLDFCSACAAEVTRLQDLSVVWTDPLSVTTLQRRVRQILGLPEEIRTPAIAWNDAVKAPASAWSERFRVSLEPLLRPAGAYGEGVAFEESTVEVPVIQDGEVISGLKGVLVRTDRDLYVRISTSDAQSVRKFGDRKAFISISDTALDQPILQRKIDIGVTVLLGTDVRLSRNSRLAVEMLPEWES